MAINKYDILDVVFFIHIFNQLYDSFCDDEQVHLISSGKIYPLEEKNQKRCLISLKYSRFIQATLVPLAPSPVDNREYGKQSSLEKFC